MPPSGVSGLLDDVSDVPARVKHVTVSVYGVIVPGKVTGRDMGSVNRYQNTGKSQRLLMSRWLEEAIGFINTIKQFGYKEENLNNSTFI